MLLINDFGFLHENYLILPQYQRLSFLYFLKFFIFLVIFWIIVLIVVFIVA